MSAQGSELSRRGAALEGFPSARLSSTRKHARPHIPCSRVFGRNGGRSNCRVPGRKYMLRNLELCNDNSMQLSENTGEGLYPELCRSDANHFGLRIKFDDHRITGLYRFLANTCVEVLKCIPEIDDGFGSCLHEATKVARNRHRVLGLGEPIKKSHRSPSGNDATLERIHDCEHKNLATVHHLFRRSLALCDLGKNARPGLGVVENRPVHQPKEVYALRVRRWPCSGAEHQRQRP